MPLYTTTAGYRVEWPGTPEQAKRLGWKPAEPVTDKYVGMTKAELVAIADQQGIDTSGTKADLVERLTAQGSAPADDAPTD